MFKRLHLTLRFPHFHLPWKSSCSTRDEGKRIREEHTPRSLQEQGQILSQERPKQNSNKVINQDVQNGDVSLLPAKSFGLESGTNKTEKAKFEAELKEALDEAFSKSSRATSSPKCELVTKRVRGKVFPSQRKPVANSQAARPVDVAQDEARFFYPKVVALSKWKLKCKCKLRWPTCCCFTIAIRKRQQRSSPTARLRKVLKAPDKVCVSANLTPTKPHLFVSEQLLVKIRSKVWLPCRLVACSSSGNSSRRGGSINKMAVAAADNVTPPHTPVAAEAAAEAADSSVAEEGNKEQVFLRRAPSSPDPEYWISTDTDYVVLEVNKKKSDS